MARRIRVVCWVWVGCAAAAVVWLGLHRLRDPLESARAAYRRADWRTAADRARKRLERRPDDRDAMQLLARSSIRLGHREAAQAAYHQLGPEAMESEDFFLLAIALERQGESQQSWDVLERVKAEDLTEPHWLVELARLYALADRLEQTALVAARLVETPGWEMAGNVILGMARYEQGDPALASDALARALQNEEQLSRARISASDTRKLLARTLLQMGQPAEARTRLAPLLSSASDQEAYWLLSRACLQQGAIDEAEQALDRARRFADTMSHLPEPAPYVGSQRCAECHKSTHSDQQNSRHAQTFRFASDVDDFPLSDDPITDSHNAEITHRWRRDGDAIHMETSAGDTTFDSVLRYVIGSGRHSLTPVTCDTAGQVLECRLSFYGRGPIWYKTDGQAEQPGEWREYLGRPLSADAERRCLHCHATSARAALNRTGPEAADRGIGCERCHGPGGHHVKAVESDLSDLAIARPQEAPRELRIRLCGQCHSPRTGSVPDTEVAVVRFQAATLVQSRCYTESKNLDCLTCHNPHRDAETAVQHYETKCLSCHSAEPGARRTTSAAASTLPRAVTPAKSPDPSNRSGQQKACPVNPASDCIGCHMPVVENAMSHTSFTDHLIRVHQSR